MALTINPQPVAYAGTHLKTLDRLYKEHWFPFPVNCVLTRVGMMGVIKYAITDTARYTSHALRDCWGNRSITPLALNSLAKAGRHLALAIFTVVFGLLSPPLVIRVAQLEGMIPQRW